MQFINTCESLEVNKDYYLGCIEKYKHDINSSILNHNLKNFETLLNDYFDMNSKYDDLLLTSDFINICSIQKNGITIHKVTNHQPGWWFDVGPTGPLLLFRLKTVW